MQKKDLAHIVGIGAYLPHRILANSDFEQMVETTDEWIVSRTGIKERRIAEKEEFTSQMGAAAALNALQDAGCTPADIDMIIVATMTPDYTSSSTAALVQAQINAPQAAAMDVQAACSGFIYALSLAKAYVESKTCKRVLVIASEKMSAYLDYTDRSTCVLFGDGAAAVVVSPEPSGFAIDAVSIGADGTLAHLITVPAGGVRLPASAETVEARLHYFKMDGKEVFKHAVRRMSAAARQCMETAKIHDEEIRWLVPHQANMRIIDAMAKGFHVADDCVYKTVHKYGNTSASSVPIALEELIKTQPIKQGEHLLLVAFGAGLTWGAAILTKRGS